MPNVFRKSKVLRNHFNLTSKTKNREAMHELVVAKKKNRNLPRNKNWFRGNEHLHVLSHSVGKENVLRVCVVRSKGGIGDVLMTTPLVKSIKLRYPDCHLTYATDKNYAGGALFDILEHNPYIDELIPMHTFNAKNYHFYVDVTPTGLSRERKGMPVPNRIDMFAEAAGIRLVDPKPTLVLTNKERLWAKEMVYKWGRGKKLTPITVHVSSVDSRRNWPAKYTMELVGRLSKLRPELLFIIFDQHKKGTWGLRKSIDASQYDIRAKAALINESVLFLGPDSGLMHIAGALEKDMVTFFGPTDPDARINHYINAEAVMADIQCLKCWYSPCMLNYACMRELRVQKALNKVLDKLNEKSLPTELVDCGSLYIESEESNALLPPQLVDRLNTLFPANVGDRSIAEPTMRDHVLEVLDIGVEKASRLEPRVFSSALVIKAKPGELSVPVFNKLKTYKRVYALSTWAKEKLESHLIKDVELLKVPMPPAGRAKRLTKDPEELVIGATNAYYSSFFKNHKFVVSQDPEELVEKCDVYLEADPYLFDTYPLMTALKYGLMIIVPTFTSIYDEPVEATDYTDIPSGVGMCVSAVEREDGKVYYKDEALKEFETNLNIAYEEAILNTNSRISFFKKHYEPLGDINRLIKTSLVSGD